MNIEISTSKKVTVWKFKVGDVYLDDDVMMIINTDYNSGTRTAVNLANGGTYKFTKNSSYHGTLKSATLKIGDI